MSEKLKLPKAKRSIVEKIIVWFLLLVAMTFSFADDLFDMGAVSIPYVDLLGVGTTLYDGAHIYSNRLVFCKALADSLDMDTYGWNMGFLNGPEGEYGVDTAFLPIGNGLPTGDGWTSGVQDGTSIFAVYNNDWNTSIYQEGYTIVLLNGEEREIVEVIEGVPYSHVVLEGDDIDVSIHGTPVDYQLFDDEGEEIAIFTFTAYTSQWGLEGLVVSFLYNNVTKTSDNIDLIISFFTALVLMAIYALLVKKWGHLVGFSYLITCFLSPWIVSFARQYGLIVFTCALPILAALCYNLFPKKNLMLIFVFACVMVKAMCGYEYLSTVMITMEAFFVLDFFAAKTKVKRIAIFKQMVYVGVVAMLAFVVVLLMHAQMRGSGDIMEGLNQIYQNDVLKRTSLGSADSSDATISASLSVSIPKIISLYHDGYWYTPVLTIFENVSFMMIALLPFINAAYEHFILKKVNRPILIYTVLSWTATVSWYVLAKGYSYIHAHFAFLLWYFGFVQVCVLAGLVLFIHLVRLCAKKDSFRACGLCEES